MSAPAAGKPEKTMSSRLLTMKFMQRAAASAAAKEPQSGSGDAPSTPKRQRLSEPGSPATPQSDLDAIAAALAAEEEKRREAISRQAAEAGETQWMLDIPAATSYATQPLVVAADSLDAEDDIPQGGRRAYGNFKRKNTSTSQPAPATEAKGEDEDEDMDDGSADTPEAMKRKKQKAIAKAAKKAMKNRPDKDRLSSLSSISGSKSQPPGGSMKKKRKSQ